MLIPPGIDAAMLDGLKKELCLSMGQALGTIVFTDIPIAFVAQDDSDAVQKAITARVKNRQDFVVFVNPWVDDKRPYDAFRRATDINMGAPSICIKQQKLSRAWFSSREGEFRGVVAGNVLKVNSRFNNGINQSITFTLTGHANMDNTIILGADVAHPGQSSKGAGSIAAMVGTQDNTGLSYGGSARPNYPRQEVGIAALPLRTKNLTACFSGLMILTQCSRSE